MNATATEVSDFQNRLALEEQELKQRHEALREFRKTDKHNSLSEKQQRLLWQQFKAMGDYLAILQDRLDDLGVPTLRTRPTEDIGHGREVQ